MPHSSSVLLTIDLPAFDPATKQLSSTQHHVIAGPAPFAESLGPNYTMTFSTPPSRPYQTSVESIDSPELAGKPRKRRRTAKAEQDGQWLTSRESQSTPNQPDQAEWKQHKELAHRLAPIIQALRDAWDPDRAWTGPVPANVRWRAKGEHSLHDLDMASLVMSHTKADTEAPRRIILDRGDNDVTPLSDLVNSVVLNPLDQVARLSVSARSINYEIALPPSSGFQLSDFDSWSSKSSGLAELGAEHGGWDILLLDPPWPNASAARSSSYSMFDPYALGKLDMPALLGKNPAIVAVWVTNRAKYRRLLKDKLMPSWGLSGIVEWTWVKVTTAGEPVWSLDGNHRRCYEGLFVGQYTPVRVDLPPLPTGKVFMSVPLGHSRKPFILDLLRPYLPKSLDRAPNVLELFARTALAGLPRAPKTRSAGSSESVERGLYMSVGNEAAKFNVVDPAEERDLVCAGGDRTHGIASSTVHNSAPETLQTS